MTWRLGFDIGGTFTDFVLMEVESGRTATYKTLTTPGDPSEAVKRFKGDQEARSDLADTLELGQVAPEDFDAVFYVGGRGVLWDLAEDRVSQALIAAVQAAGRPLALVGHGPAALRHAVNSGGRPLVEGRRVTASANSEEAEMGSAGSLPFLLQDELVRLGAVYSKGPDWAPHVVCDGALITGQNRGSAATAARAVLEMLRRSEIRVRQERNFGRILVETR